MTFKLINGITIQNTEIDLPVIVVGHFFENQPQGQQNQEQFARIAVAVLNAIEQAAQEVKIANDTDVTVKALAVLFTDEVKEFHRLSYPGGDAKLSEAFVREYLDGTLVDLELQEAVVDNLFNNPEIWRPL